MNFAQQKSIYDSDILAVEPEMPGTFFLPPSKTAFPGSITPVLDTMTGGEFGYEQGFDFINVVRVSVFPTAIKIPVVNDLMNVVDMLGKTIQCSIKSRQV